MHSVQRHWIVLRLLHSFIFRLPFSPFSQILQLYHPLVISWSTILRTFTRKDFIVHNVTCNTNLTIVVPIVHSIDCMWCVQWWWVFMLEKPLAIVFTGIRFVLSSTTTRPLFLQSLYVFSLPQMHNLPLVHPPSHQPSWPRMILFHTYAMLFFFLVLWVGTKASVSPKSLVNTNA